MKTKINTSHPLKALLLAGLLAGPMLAFNAMSQTREDIQWSPLDTWTDGTNTYAAWDDANNWQGGKVPTVIDTNAAGPAYFNAAYNSTVICVASNNTQVTGIGQLMCGFGGAGTLLITNGANFQAGFCYGGQWTGIGFVAGPGTLIVGPGSDFSCASHLWVGQGTADQGRVDINGGTLHIPSGQLGVSWNGIGGTNYITIENGGALYLSQWASKTLGAPGSPGNIGIMNIIGANSKVVITNNALSYMPVLIASNQLIAFSGQGQIQASYNPTLNITVLTAVAPSGPDTPVFSVQPTNLIVKLGGTATLSAAASPATGYQWMFNSSPLTDGNGISGSHTANLTVANFSAAETGLYSVVATNASPASQSDRPFNSSQSVSVTAESFNLFPVVTINGVPGNTYVTQYATSLSGPWTSFSTNTIGAGPLNVVDTTSPLSMVKFYRVIQTAP